MSYEPTVWVDGDHVTSAKLNKLEQGVNSMSYVPTVWSAGDVVTAEKLNKLEQGVAEGGGGGDYPHLIVDTVQQTVSCDKTYEECTALFVGSEVEGEYPIIEYMDGTPHALGVMYDYTPDNYIRINIGVNIAYYLPDGTITTEQPQ